MKLQHYVMVNFATPLYAEPKEIQPRQLGPRKASKLGWKKILPNFRATLKEIA